MNAFEIFRLDGKPGETVQSLNFGVHFPHDIFDEARLSIRLFSDELFILSLEQGVQFARPRFFHDSDQILKPKKGPSETCRVTNPRWLCAPPSDIALEQGQTV